MATIKDVAKHADVGIATVSRMINGTGYVSESSRKGLRKRSVNSILFRTNVRGIYQGKSRES